MKSTHIVSLTDAKAKLSAMIGEIIYKHDRFLIKRRGKTVAALIPIDDYQRFEKSEVVGGGLAALAGICAEIESFGNLMDEIVADRQKSKDRQVDI